MPDNPPNGYITTAEAADYLGVHVDTLRKWTKNGRLTPAHTTPGGHHKWTVEQLAAEPFGTPCCDNADNLLNSHGWWVHNHGLVQCSACDRYTYISRALLPNVHICPACDLTWTVMDNANV